MANSSAPSLIDTLVIVSGLAPSFFTVAKLERISAVRPTLRPPALLFGTDIVMSPNGLRPKTGNVEVTFL